MAAAATPACLLIADISGYTSYLAGVELDHAQGVMSDLIGTVVAALRPSFRLAKLEGDAAFMWMAADVLDGTMLLDTIERCYFGFRRRRRDVRQATSCPCDACARIPDLDLKFVVHHGDVMEHRVAGRRELMGRDVILVHRLLKNEVHDTLGIDAYALLTAACIEAAGLMPEPLAMRPITETYDHVGAVACWVLDLERRWSDEDARARVRVGPDEAAYGVSVATRVPPQVAWAFLTEPGQRRSWQPWVTSVDIAGATGGRRGPGSENHCMHGEHAVVEEILDWRPYDYVTDRTIVDSPSGPVKLFHTIELEPTAEGTTIHMRFAAPKTARGRAEAAVFGPAYEAALRGALPKLVADLEAAYGAGQPDD
jgi:uncharacterized protein YndB with AHSA1/START domain